MICPHCSTSLKYKERGNKTCRHCRKIFALEPRSAPLRLSDVSLTRVCARLSHQGQIPYTLAQLCYSLNRRAMAKRRAPTLVGPVIGIGVMIVIVTTMWSLLPAWPVRWMIGLVCLFAALVLTVRLIRDRARQRRPGLLLTEAALRSEVLTPWLKVYGRRPAGLIDPDRPPVAQPVAPVHLRAVLACPQPAIRHCLIANDLPPQLSIGLLPTEGPFTPADLQVIDALRQRPELPLLLLHDASPAGCNLYASLAPNLGLPVNRRVIDLGLWPRQAIKRQLLRLWAAPSPELVERLASRGPGQPPRLSDPERTWLLEGNTSPLLGLAPAHLLALVTRAVTRATAALPPPAADDTSALERQARAVGFLSLPGAL